MNSAGPSLNATDAVRIGDAAVRSVDGRRWRMPTARPATGAKALIAIAPAMGVGALPYALLMRALAGRSAAVGFLLPRGATREERAAERRAAAGMNEIVDRDWPPALEVLRHTAGTGRRLPLFVVGHSFGGHLALLEAARRPDSIDGVALVAAGIALPRAYDLVPRAGLRLLSLIGPALARLLGHYPGDWLGFGGRQSRALFCDWVQQTRTGQLPLSAGDARALERWRGHLYAVRIVDDLWAPRDAVEALVAHAPSASTSLAEVFPAEIGRDPVGHFGWLQRPEGIADRIMDWVASTHATTVCGESNDRVA